MKNNSEQRAQDSSKSGKRSDRGTITSDPNLHIPKKVAGGATGTMVGALVAGPLGAVVGGVVGTFIGAVAAKDALQPKHSQKAPGKRRTRPKSIHEQRAPKTRKNRGTGNKRINRSN